MEVSVILPTYNRGPLVAEAVASVLAQQNVELECIVIDDESPDDTRGALAPYLDRITYVRQENTGVNGARNAAIALATGRYIAMLDDDDAWLPGKLRAQLDWLARFPEAAFCFSDFFIWRDDYRQPHGLQTWFHRPMPWREVFGEPVAEGDHGEVFMGNIYRALLENPLVLPTTAVFRRDLLPKGLRFPEGDPICGDWEFFARIAREHSGLFLHWETALNRSHEDEYRLTRTPQVKQFRKRDAMLHRVWGNDQAFLAEAENQRIFDQVVGDVLNTRFIQELIYGDPDEARLVLKRLKASHQAMSAKTRLGRVLMNIPGGIAPIRKWREKDQADRTSA